MSDDENISYEKTINKNNYDTLFYQVPYMEKADTLVLQEKVRNDLLSKYIKAELKKTVMRNNEGISKCSNKNISTDPT